MLPKWLSNGLKRREAAREDAAALVRDYGDDAYRLARTRAREAREGQTIDAGRDAGHWDRVRAQISRRLKLTKTDTATRMLDDQR